MFNIIEMFNRISPFYDRVNRLLSFGLDMRWRRSLARHLPPRPNLLLLDIATGTGKEIEALKQMKAPILKAVGVDLADEMLTLARQNHQDCSFIHADAADLPFSDQSFDVCTICFGIRNVTDPLNVLNQMYRVLKPNGRVLILEFSIPKTWIRPLYLFYLRHLITFIGGILANHRPAYRYLNNSIESFASPSQMVEQMQTVGFKDVLSRSLCLGSIMMYQGDRL
jgi:demethylmenaquinone methyltransferase / 2-methoxy-6-polyprenyl-1,4-benzoquinol methylase